MSATSLLGYCSLTMFGAPGGAVGGGVAAAAAGIPGATWAKAPGAAPSRSNATQKSLSTGLFTGGIITRSMRFAYENCVIRFLRTHVTNRNGLDGQYRIIVGELNVSTVDRYRAANCAVHSSNRS